MSIGMGLRVAGGFLAATVCWAAEAPPNIKSMSDAEIYISVRQKEMAEENEKTLAAARAKFENELKTKSMAEIAGYKKKIIEQDAELARLRTKLAALTEALKSAGGARSFVTPERWGKPVFEDNFSAATPDNKPVPGKWTDRNKTYQIVNGMLTGRHDLPVVMPFTGKALRVEYDTLTLSETPADASLFVQEKDGLNLFAGIGSDLNKTCRINLGPQKEVVAKKEGAFLVPGKPQHMVVEAGEGKVRIEVDGETILDYAGEKAPKSLQDAVVALYAWNPGMNFDNVKIFIIK